MKLACIVSALLAATATAVHALPPGVPPTRVGSDRAVLVREDPECPGVRPGAVVFVNDGNNNGISFTLGFLFAGSDGHTYAVADGQLLDAYRAAYLDTEFKDVDDTVWPAGKGPWVSDSTLRPVLQARLRQKRRAVLDVAWLQLKRGTSFDSRVCAFGPTAGVEAGMSSAPERAFIYGQGLFDDGERPIAPDREDVIPKGLDDEVVVALATPQEGKDSGAPVLLAASDGMPTAIGISKGTAGGLDAGRAHVGTPVMRLMTLIPMAEKALGVRLRLLTFETGKARK